jgi:hypothetical protein
MSIIRKFDTFNEHNPHRELSEEEKNITNNISNELADKEDNELSDEMEDKLDDIKPEEIGSLLSANINEGKVSDLNIMIKELLTDFKDDLLSDTIDTPIEDIITDYGFKFMSLYEESSENDINESLIIGELEINLIKECLKGIENPKDSDIESILESNFKYSNISIKDIKGRL